MSSGMWSKMNNINNFVINNMIAEQQMCGQSLFTFICHSVAVGFRLEGRHVCIQFKTLSHRSNDMTFDPGFKYLQSCYAKGGMLY